MSYQPAALDLSVTGNITVLDSVVAAPAGAGQFVSGTSTAGSFIALSTGMSENAWAVQLTGTWTGSMWFEASLDSTNGNDGFWINLLGRQTATGGIDTNLAGFSTTNGLYRGNLSGFKYFRVRSKGATHTGTAAILINVSTGTGAVFFNASIPAGADCIGGVASSFSNAVTRSGTITTGGTAQTLAPAAILRNGLNIQNTHASSDLWITEDGTTTAALNVGYKLTPGSSGKINTRNLISIWGPTTGQPFAATEH